MKSHPQLTQIIQRRLRISEYTWLIILSLFVGLVVGAAACLFRAFIHATGRMLFLNPDPLGLMRHWGLPHVLVMPFLPALGGLVVGGLLYGVLRLEGGHGVPAVIKSVATGVMSFRPSMAVKSATSAIIMGTGGSAGPEGPIVEIGSVIGAMVGRRLGISRANQGILVGCGAAAGLSAVFDAPIGAVFFTLELILPYISIRIFSPVILSSVMAGVFARSVFGRNPAFQVPAELAAGLSVSSAEVAIFSLLGVMCAFLSWLFVTLMSRGQEMFTRQQQIPLWLRPAIGGFLTGAIGLVFHPVMGEGYDFVTTLLVSRPETLLLVFLPLAKIAATSCTLGSGGTGGVFAPAMVTGAMGGALFARLLEVLPLNVGAPPGLFVLVGMAGVVAGMLNAPLAGMFIIFEVTGGNYELLVPMGCTVAVTIVVTRRLQHQASIYTLPLLRDGFDVDALRKPDPLLRATVSDAMHTDFVTLRPEMNLLEIIALAADTEQPAFPVVGPAGDLMGVISMNDLRAVLSLQDEMGRGLIAGDICDPHPPRLMPGSTLQQASHAFAGTSAEGIPVVNPSAPKQIVGMIYRSDVFKSYKKQSAIPPF
ncbi:MAG: chloride channel protein [Candidatus Sumerlaeia bacterium]